MKKCTKCGVEKNLEEFHRNKKSKDGRTFKCKECVRFYSKSYRKENREKIKAYAESWRKDNPGYRRSYREANKEKLSVWEKAYYESNKEKIAEYAKKYRESNRDKERARREAWREANPDYHNAYRKKRYAEDPVFRAVIRLRGNANRLGDYKNKKTIELVGCSPEEFWRRNGSPSVEELKDLHIDHIVPLSWFDLTNEDHVKVACNWTNLQYLSGRDNESKKNRYAGRPDAILGYKEDFNINKHVEDMIEFLNSVNH